MQKLNYLLVLCFFIFAGCITQYKPPAAAGKTTEVIVLCNDANWTEISDLIPKVLEREIYTPTTEKVFDIKKVLPSEINKYKYRKNCLVLGIVGDEIIDSLLAKSAMKKLLAGEEYMFGGQDFFVKGQFFLIIAAPTIYKLKEIIENKSDVVFNYFVENVAKTIKNDLYKDGYQKTVSEKLLKDYGFTISVPRGWKVVEEKIGFVELARHSPDRFISICWETTPLNATTELNLNAAIEFRNKIGVKYYDGDYVDTTFAKFYQVNFHNSLAGKLDGIWQNDEQVMGGPFKTYFISAEGRLYTIDMHIFAPGYKKWKFLQQLELIIDTFSFLSENKQIT
ncbi:MAG: DUF4837 family protein [bacterium]